MTEPTHEEATVLRKDYLKTAFETLEEGIKNSLEDLRDKFDQKTKRAIDDLIGKKPEGVPEDILSETQSTLEAFRHHEYHKLTIQEKGSLQRWALAKRIDSNTVEEISNIKAKQQSQENTEARADNEISMSLDDLLLVCGEQKKIAELKQKVYKFLGKEIQIHSLWANIVDTVNKLKSVGDTAASSNQTAGLVWGIFKVLLQFAVISEKGAEAAFSGMQTAVNVMQRAATYEKYIYDPAGHQTLAQSATEPFEGCLISTYQRVFKFFVIASKCFTKSKSSLCWYVFWSDKDILEFEQDIFKYEQKLFQDSAIKSLIDQDSKANTIHDLVKEMNTHVVGTQETIVGVLSQQSGITLLLQSLQSKVHDIPTLMRTNSPEVTRDKMLGWFSAARVEDHHRSAKDKRTIDTAEWVLKKQQYLAWSNDSGPSLLWIKGISGAGKTTIISRLVDQYGDCAGNGDDFAKPHLAYFYCKRDATDRRFSEDIFRSFVRQLASAYHPLPERLVQTYRTKSSTSSLSTKLYGEDYEGLLIELMPRTTETVLILDALDECVGEDTRSSNEIGKVLKTFNRLLDTNLPIKIVVASRYENRIKHNFTGKYTIEISADDNSSDIEKMVVARIDDYNLTDPTVRINEGLKEKILEVFNDKSQGKFQWATLHIDHLLNGLTDGVLMGAFDVEETLGELPEGLVDTYNEIFHRINTKIHKRQKEAAFRVFKWLLALGTCDEKVLIAAVCQRLQGQPGDYPSRVEGDAGYVLTACQHLVTIQDSEFRFSHLSVDEYLRNHQPELVDTCHYDVAKVCASVLFRYRTAEGAMEPWAYCCQKVKLSVPLQRDRQQNFLNELWFFANNQWHIHFQKISSPSQRNDIQTIVDDSFPSAFTTWLNVRVTGLTKLNESSITAFIPSRLSISRDNHGRAFQSFWGVPLGEQLWTKPLNLLPVTIKPLEFRPVVDTAFSCGILNKLQRLVKKEMTMLLDGYDDSNGHDDRRQDSQRLLHQLFRSMMDAQSGRAEKAMYGNRSPTLLAKRLLNLGGITNAGEGFLALCKVFTRWRQTISGTNESPSVMFEKLFSIDPQQDQHVEQCYGELARLTLLFVGVIDDKEYQEELLDTFSNVKKLRDNLFDRFPQVSTIRYHHLSPPVGFDMDLALTRAAGRSDKRYIDLLLSHGANTNAATEEGTPLMAALSNEMIENAMALLQAGADMDGVISNPIRGYGNITIMACSIPDSGLFQLLRKYDALDIDSVTETGECLTPLIAACRFRRIDRVNVLLSMGVDFDRRLTTGLYTNSLCAAVDGHSMRAIRQLLRRNLSQPKEDALEIWRKKHMRGPTPKYEDSIWDKCQALLSWLTLAVLQCPDEEEQEGSGTGVTGYNEVEGGTDDPDDYIWDGCDDSGDEARSDDDGYDTTNDKENVRDKGIEPGQQLAGTWGYQRTDNVSGSWADSNTPTLRAAECDGGNFTSPSDEEVLKNINNSISWLHQDCVQEPQVVQRELAEVFGFSLSEKNNSMAMELVRNALRKGFQNILRLSHEKRNINDIANTWTRFLDLAEDSMGLVGAFENAFDGADSIELNRLHKRIGKLANGGVEQG